MSSAASALCYRPFPCDPHRVLHRCYHGRGGGFGAPAARGLGPAPFSTSFALSVTQAGLLTADGNRFLFFAGLSARPQCGNNFVDSSISANLSYRPCRWAGPGPSPILLQQLNRSLDVISSSLVRLVGPTKKLQI